ncbi:MAG: 5-methyltetrahydropteroyltriglutamate--homocysteine S-methyltransferase [Burkholderiales bacterium]
MALTHLLGYPRIGARRELKFALERFWSGAVAATELLDTGRRLRATHWSRQQAAGIDILTAGDFSYYDPMLDLIALLGCIPARFGVDAGALSLTDYFTLARGNDRHPPLEMTKWFDTNYHYLVPELGADTRFDGGVDWYFDAVGECRSRARTAKAALVGPITFLRLAKCLDPGFDRLQLLEPLTRAYARVLERLATLGVDWVQLDEPVLATELAPEWLAAYAQAYSALSGRGPRILLATYFGGVGDHAEAIARLPVQGVHLDLVRDPAQLAAWHKLLPPTWVLSAGAIDGRNVWRTDLRAALARLRPVHEAIGDRLWIAPSCSLSHVPVSAAQDEGIDPEIGAWLAFADEKLAELGVLARALDQGEACVRSELEAADAAASLRRASPRVADPAVRARMAAVAPAMTERKSPFEQRIRLQRERLRLPLFPTTTIGSFPQTAQIRGARAALKREAIGTEAYQAAMRSEIEHAVRCQERIGLDVLVHGEAERGDMVEYFADKLAGFTATGNGWVQSYGSRCVKPPIVFGDVSRPAAMTVEESVYAQSLTERPMKGMLTGPVTLLQWSFVRDDQAREATAVQIALAIRDEVAALERAGIGIIQIDEPAIREGLPLKRADWGAYLAWAVRSFRLAASVVGDETQIHTHMCYSEFRDILPAIAAMDADAITIETSRSHMDLLDDFAHFRYPNEIGPGVYDIHSPRVPSVDEMVALLDSAVAVIPAQRLWVNPDCGLKTRGWPEVEPALANLVAAARRMRERFAAGQD